MNTRIYLLLAIMFAAIGLVSAMNWWTIRDIYRGASTQTGAIVDFAIDYSPRRSGTKTEDVFALNASFRTSGGATYRLEEFPGVGFTFAEHKAAVSRVTELKSHPILTAYCTDSSRLCFMNADVPGQTKFGLLLGLFGAMIFGFLGAKTKPSTGSQ